MFCGVVSVDYTIGTYCPRRFPGNGKNFSMSAQVKNFKLIVSSFSMSASVSCISIPQMLEGSLNIMIQKLAVLSQPRLTDAAVPSLFNGRPAYVSRSNKTDKQGQLAIALPDDGDNSNYDVNSDNPPFLNEIYASDNDIEKLRPMQPALVFVSGYCVNSLF
ncbi:hypothetical protein AVEN_210314-1 [Araneus ventricosus]|uniref:Uncharacterized protein n=1 Tax=Araneus ventricosus TaxID=182803 RepID=A0A4Y2QEK5_ARAVE|nr:hypothetical protein AVEN_210314-1 [Araneus ventricosus]